LTNNIIASAASSKHERESIMCSNKIHRYS
jgi:hypothetical protein